MDKMLDAPIAAAGSFIALVSILFGQSLSASGETSPLVAWSDHCKDTWVPPETTVNTTLRLQQLREILQEYNISAYVVPSNDEHQSEYIAEHAKRRAFISGFTGSAGEAIVTSEYAALWADSRYYIQAANQLDCNWQLMPTGQPDTPSKDDWLKKVLPEGAFVSADPKTTSFNEWETLRKSLEDKNITLEVITENLVDQVWADEQPPYPENPIVVQDIKYAGETWQDKIARIRNYTKANNLDTFVITALDEVAWTLNLRGGEIPFTPVFRSYLIVFPDSVTVYMPSEKVTAEIIQHLNTNGTTGTDSVKIKGYEEIWDDLEEIGNTSTKIGLPKPFSYSLGVSYLIHTMLPAEKITDIVSPALIYKDYKNEVEANGMKTAHIKDAVALCVFFARVTEDFANGNASWTELSAVTELDALRWQQPLSRGPSFDTIAAVGVNAALPHYEPSEATNRNITDHELLLVDSGGQYLDGTTDVTRTVHFGSPRAEEIRVYTTLLMGCIDVVTTTFPQGKTMAEIEILIRRPLYSLGLDYGHGSTHGIGSLLSVHESFNQTYHLSFFGSQEPGYYKENDFGIRLENIVSVVTAHPLSEASNFLTFEPTTLVPYERKLINSTIMEKRHINWLNDYHQKVRDNVGGEMLRQGYTTEHRWLLKQTEPIL